MEDITDNGWNVITKTLAKPKGTFQQATSNKKAYLKPQKPIILSCDSTEQLRMASIAVRYYESIGRVLAPDRLSPKWIEIIRKQLQNLKDQKNAAAVSAALANLNKTVVFTTWSKGVIAFLDGHIGVCNAPISYLICDIMILCIPTYFHNSLLTNHTHKNFPLSILNL